MPDVLGRYRLMKLLSTGGMGEVFLARQEGPAGFAKTVVVKRILRHLAKDQGFIDLFLNEAQLAAQLQHPNIAQVFGLEHEGQSWLMAMEYVHGRSVRDLLDVAQARGLQVPPPVAARLASQALQGLHYAHQLTDARGKPLGILHRDVTPENLLVSFSGALKIVDFGIARAMTGAVTRVGKPKGKVGYMAPELTVSGSALDGRADLYGVGVVLYEMLRLIRPPNVPTTTSDAVSGVREPYESDPLVPPGLNDILAKAMAPAPEGRFPTAGAMSEALEAWILAEGQTVLSSDITTFLEALYGRGVIEANPAVLPLSPADQPSSGASALAGTQPLSAVPSGVFDPSQPALRALPFPAGSPTSGRRPRRTGLWVGGVTLVMMALVGALALTSPSAATGADAGVAQVAAPVARPPSEGVDAGQVERAALTPDADAGLEVVADPSEPAMTERSTEDGGEVDAELAPAVDEEPLDGGLGQDRRPTEPSRQATRSRHRKARTGKVVLKVIAGAEVFYGGRALGITPIEPVEVPAGTAVFVLRHRRLGVTRRLSVRVPPGGVVVLRADLSTR